MSFISALLRKRPSSGATSKSDSLMEEALNPQSKFEMISSQPLQQLPTVSSSSLSPVGSNELQIKEREVVALEQLASATRDISQFLSGGGMASALSLYARTNSISAILGGLASNGGRNALDARVLGQNSIEIVEQISLAFDKLQEKLEAKMKGEVRDPEMKDGEEAYLKWKAAQK